jgi:hypothetical protein
LGLEGSPADRANAPNLHADEAYDSYDMRRGLRASGITPYIARRGIDSSERRARHCWLVERTLAWLLVCRRLGIGYERRADLL